MRNNLYIYIQGNIKYYVLSKNNEKNYSSNDKTLL